MIKGVVRIIACYYNRGKKMKPKFVMVSYEGGRDGVAGVAGLLCTKYIF